MFYSNDLLSLKKGRFGVLWLAATRGVTRVSKRDILAVDIVSSCSELLEYVNGSKRSRLSLYLSAQLMYGLCRVYVEKVCIVLRDANDLYSRALVSFRPHSVQIDEVRKSRGKSRCDVDIELPLTSNDDFGSFNLLGQLVASQPDFEISMPSLDNSFSLQARLEDITLIDAATTPRAESGLVFGEDFQTELLSDLLGNNASASAEAVCGLFQDPIRSSRQQSVLNLSPDDKENRIRIEDLLPRKSTLETLQPLRKRTRQSSVYELDNIDEQSKREESQILLSEIEAPPLMEPEVLHISEPQIPTSCQDVSSTARFPLSEISTIQPITEAHQAPEETTGVSLLAGKDQVPEAAQTKSPKPETLQPIEEALQGTSPKRRRLDAEVAANDVSIRNSSLDLGCPRPCAASSAVKSKPPQVALATLHLSQLSAPDAQVVPHRRRRRRRNCYLVRDEVLQLSKAQIMENFEMSHENLRTRAETLAPGASEAHPRRARSFYVDRLLALPANWELAISRTLGELWRSKRRLCESMPLEDSRPLSSRVSRSNLGSIRESVTESSREEARGTMSEQFSGLLAPRVSSLGLARASSSQEQEQEGRSLHIPASTQSITIPEEKMLPPPQEPPTLQETTLVASEIPPPQLEEGQPASMTEALPPRSSLPFVGVPAFYVDESALWSTVQKVFKSGESTVEFSRLLAPSSTRKQAAKAFHHLLCLLKKGRARVSQVAAFEEIFISPLNSH
ncbi:Meiotic recombination protein REC8 -like protein [Echinococcus granulosus]|nr:Meiotic recombination protein REC8 -like protein [Echinococcus granulosus]